MKIIKRSLFILGLIFFIWYFSLSIFFCVTNPNLSVFIYLCHSLVCVIYYLTLCLLIKKSENERKEIENEN